MLDRPPRVSTALVFNRRSLILMSIRKAEIDFNAADSSFRVSSDPDNDSAMLSLFVQNKVLSSGTPKHRVLDDAKSE